MFILFAFIFLTDVFCSILNPIIDSVAIFEFNNNIKDLKGSFHSEGIFNIKSDKKAEFIKVEGENLPYSDNNALFLKGSSYIKIEKIKGLNLRKPFSLFVRVRPSLAEGVIISKRGSIQNERGFHLQQIISKENIIFEFILTGIDRKGIIKDYAIRAKCEKNSLWNDIVIVYEPGKRMEIYLNGNLEEKIEPIEVPLTIVENNIPILIGAQPYPCPENPSKFFYGQIEKIVFWNRTLTLEEIKIISIPKSFGKKEMKDINKEIFDFKPANPEMVEKVLKKEVEIANVIWWGFNEEDSTEYIQAAINSGAPKILIPYTGKPWVVRGLKLKSNQEIIVEPKVVIKAKKGAFKGKNDSLIVGFNVENVSLHGEGATLMMNKKDYEDVFLYEKSEWRMGIELRHCRNIKISGFIIKDTGGDGIYIGSSKFREFLPYCENIEIKNVVLENNYRQGITVTSVKNLIIENCIFRKTSGTPPSAGLDIEPNYSYEIIENCIIKNCISENNDGAGFLVYLLNFKKGNKVSIVFDDCIAKGCKKGGFIIGGCLDEGPLGNIEIKNCKVYDNEGPGVLIYDKSKESVYIKFIECEFKNVAIENFLSEEFRYITFSPIQIFLKRPQLMKKLGGVEFVKCIVYDSKNRPFLVIDGKEKNFKVYDIKGTFKIFNSFGARFEINTFDKENVNIEVIDEIRD